MKFKKLIPITLLLSLLNNCGEIPINQVKDNLSSNSNTTSEKVVINNEIKEKTDINIQNQDSNNKKQKNIDKNNELVNNIKSIEEIENTTKETETNKNEEIQSNNVYDPPPPIPEGSIAENFERTQPIIVDPRFDINNPVPEDKTRGLISLIFIDDYKVRYYGNNIFVSKAGYDMCEVNSILKKTNLKWLAGDDLSKFESEDQIEMEMKKREDFGQENSSYEWPNTLSMYSIYVENTDLKKLIEDLRKTSFFLSVNYSQEEEGATID